MSAEKKVITIKGEEVPISQCRKFNKLYYKLGDINIQNSGDCYLINGRCYRIETGLIVYNYSVKQYVVLDNSTMINGIVDIIEDKLIIGYFNNNIKSPSQLIDKNNHSYYIFNPEIFKNNREYREQLSSGNFYHISRLPSYKFNAIFCPRKEYKYSLPYDSKEIIGYNLKNYRENYNPEISKNIRNYAPLLENLSFGLEFETTKGYIPDRILNQFGLIPLRDGSISGIEYVTVPMQGEKGLQCTSDILKILQQRTEYDDNTCSLHLHLGNVPRTKEFILAFFKIGMKIQDEIFQMFPLYKKYNYHIKNKNYSAPLPTFEILSQLDSTIGSHNIDENFGVLYKYLSMGQDFKTVGNSLEKVVAHPADPQGKQKWNIQPRYLLYNVIPLIFGNKQTIEFRIHTPTYDINKILLFIFMNSLIVNFTIRHQEKILKNKSFINNYNLIGLLNSQIESYSNSVSNLSNFRDTMYNYITKRKYNYERQIISGNILGTESEIPSPTNINWLTNQNDIKNPYLYTNAFNIAIEEEFGLHKPSRRSKPSVAHTKSIDVNDSESIREGLGNMLKESMLEISKISSDNVYYGNVDNNILTVDSLDYVKVPNFGTLNILKKEINDKS